MWRASASGSGFELDDDEEDDDEEEDVVSWFVGFWPTSGGAGPVLRVRAIFNVSMGGGDSYLDAPSCV